ncbi:MAG: M18 family aminopeptidase [Candidatus Cloacimonetes bacterium]|nr:M18 family aminopeptidase [Candidatus Cloacimonadota bacterium]MCA9785140.1 M18 family aminopeptidase [Candidatus Cloacimonadota bacterium]
MSQHVLERASQLLAFLDSGPSPWHVVHTACQMLGALGFQPLVEGEDWDPRPGEARYVIRNGSSLVAFVVGEKSPGSAGFRLIGAHTDSPTLRIKPRPTSEVEGMLKLAVDVYGGPILATFVDRDLDLAGRLLLAPDSEGGEPEPMLLRFGRPVVQVPSLAIHMDRDVNTNGLVLDKQKHLSLLAGLLPLGHDARSTWLGILAREAGVEPERILAWELNVADCQPASFSGFGNEFINSPRLDNLASCHAALLALCGCVTRTRPMEQTCVISLFDHEEVGSRSSRGADGAFLRDVLQRLCQRIDPGPESLQRALANSWQVSVDMAHAFHPNRPEVYEDLHRVRLNGGPVIKFNPNRRYATDAVGDAWFQLLCGEAGVPFQHYVHHGNLACGSTIGPLSESGLGVRTVDVGNPMLSMHSIRETAGVLDHDAMVRALSQFLQRD